MTALTRWNPFNEMQTLQGRLNTLLDSAFGRQGDLDDGLDWSEWSPAVDIFEDDFSRHQGAPGAQLRADTGGGGLSTETLAAAIEAILFTSNRPLKLRELHVVMDRAVLERANCRFVD